MKQQNFKKKELERLGCTEEEIKLVTDYQKKLPVLNKNDDTEVFCIDARTLHTQLNVGKHFSDWLKIRIKAYSFLENIDFIMVSPNSEIKGFAIGGDTRSKNYLLTISMAENLALVEKTKIGQIVRNYFRLMRTIVKRNKDWWAVRDPEKEEYKKMSKDIDLWCKRILGHSANRFTFASEADMLNLIVSEKTSKELKSALHIQTNDLLRDYLIKEHNEELLFLEQQNQILLRMDMKFDERKNLLTQMYKAKFQKHNGKAV